MLAPGPTFYAPFCINLMLVIPSPVTLWFSALIPGDKKIICFLGSWREGRFCNLSLMPVPMGAFRLPRWLSGKESTCQCRRRSSDTWVRKISWRREWQPTPIFLSEKSHGQRSLVGCSPQGHTESDTMSTTTTPSQVDACIRDRQGRHRGMSEPSRMRTLP